MGESTVMAQPKESTSEELVVERLEIVATEDPGGTEPDEGSSGDSGSGSSGDGGVDPDVPWHNSPEE
jgi:hypothetical protein